MRLDKLTSKYSLVFWGKRFTALALLSGKEAAFMVQMLGLVVMDMRASTFGKNTIYPCSFSPTSQTLKQPQATKPKQGRRADEAYRVGLKM